MKNTFTFLLLVLSFGLAAQNQTRIDSLLATYETSIQVTDKVDILILLAREYSRVNPELTVKYAKQAIELAKEVNYQEGISDACYGLGWVQIKAGDYSAAVGFLREAIKSAEQADYMKGKANAYNGLGIVHRNKGEYDSALNIYQKAFEIYSKVDDLRGLSASYNSIAIVHHIKGDNERAIENFTHSLKIDEGLGDSIGVASSLNNLGYVYQGMGNYPKSLEYYFKSFDIKERLGDQRGMAGSLTNIGIVYKEQSQWQKALEHFLQALDIQQALKDKRYMAASYSDIGSIQKEMGQDSLALDYYIQALRVQEELDDKLGLSKTNLLIGEIYIDQQSYGKAIGYLETALANAQQIEAKPSLASALNVLGKVHWLMKRPIQAKKYLRQGIAMAKEAGFPLEIREGAKIMVEVEKELQNFPAALEAFELYHTFYDSLLGEEKAKQFAQLQVQYETEKKEQEIKSLAQEASIRELRLKQSNFNFIILSIVLVIIILVGLVLYLVYRQRQLSLNQKNQDIEQKLLRVQMNPHFIFNAMSAIQDYMVRGDAKQAGLYLTKFSKLIRQVLDNSRSEFVSLDQEINMLDNYLSLQNLRRDRPFTYDISLADGLDPEEISIPPMFAQPFVENAIEHGMLEQSEGASIKVLFSIKEECLVMKIEDNGVGIEESLKVARPDGHTSHATQITKERVELFRRITKKDILFDIKKMSPGTQVIFNLPFQYS